MKATIFLSKEEVFKIIQDKLKLEKDIEANPGKMNAKCDYNDGDFTGIEVEVDL
jgi:hypothetical protein